MTCKRRFLNPQPLDGDPGKRFSHLIAPHPYVRVRIRLALTNQNYHVSLCCGKGMVKSVAITSPNRITKFDVQHVLNLGNRNVLVHLGMGSVMRARRNRRRPRNTHRAYSHWRRSLIVMNSTGTVVMAGGLDHSKSGRGSFRAEGSTPKKVHGVWKNVARPQKLR